MSGQWSIDGEYMETCSCNFLCPCIPKNATTPATEDFCKAALAFRIDRGAYGPVSLDGLAFAVVIQSKPVMSQGDWAVGLIIDEKASEAQADAVAKIASGQAGGPMTGFSPLIGDFRGIERSPIDFSVNGLRRKVTIPGLLEQEVQGVPSASVPNECVAIDNTFHPANKRLNLATAVRSLIDCFGIRWSDATNSRNGHFAPFAWQGDTV